LRGVDVLAGSGGDIADAEEGTVAGNREGVDVVVVGVAVRIAVEQAAGLVLPAVGAAGQGKTVVTHRKRATGLDEAGAHAVASRTRLPLTRLPPGPVRLRSAAPMGLSAAL